jgi:hypothetical protein
LRREDKLLVQRVSLSSPLEIVFWVASVGFAAGGFKRVALAVKAWIDVLSAGVDLQQRKQALDLSRTLAPHEVHEVELRNALMEEELRRVTAPPEYQLVEQARAESLGPAHAQETTRPKSLDPDYSREAERDRIERYRRPAGTMDSLQFAELLDDPVNRLLGYAGGELEIAGDEELAG